MGEKEEDKAKSKGSSKQTFNERGIGRSIIGDGSAGVKGRLGFGDRIGDRIIEGHRQKVKAECQSIEGFAFQRRMIRPAIGNAGYITAKEMQCR